MPSTKRERIIRLFHHRWAVPVLGELHRSGGAKFITLVKRLGVSQGSLRHSLDALIVEGWVVRNPGYGHPLRPEYVLTRTGESLAPWCLLIRKSLAQRGIEEIALRKWSLPIVFSMRRDLERFNQVKKALPGITPRSLTLALKGLQQVRLVNRYVSDEFPPRSRYRLTPQGRSLSRLLEHLSG